MHQDVVCACLLALATPRVVCVERKGGIEFREFFLDSPDQTGIAGFPCAFHQLVPSLDVDGGALWFQIHGVDGLSCWQLVGLPNPCFTSFPFRWFRKVQHWEKILQSSPKRTCGDSQTKELGRNCAEYPDDHLWKAAVPFRNK